MQHVLVTSAANTAKLRTATESNKLTSNIKETYSVENCLKKCMLCIAKSRTK